MVRMGMVNSGIRPRPPRVRAVSMTTASPSSSQAGRFIIAPTAWPKSPKEKRSHLVMPHNARSNCTTWRNSWTAKRWRQGTQPIRPTCGGVLNHSLCRGAKLTNPLASVFWLCRTSEILRGRDCSERLSASYRCSSRLATCCASRLISAGNTILKWGASICFQANPGGFCMDSRLRPICAGQPQAVISSATRTRRMWFPIVRPSNNTRWIDNPPFFHPASPARADNSGWARPHRCRFAPG
ncbi:MAG: hypothetical protein BWY83_02821 [bacterium ADurb.Bin478]|nr:MAG: hypothetical protein BWY83_02821 [bacterium ADurb.Bin478]